MAIWAIPNDYAIEYATNGDDIASFSQKVKYLLEEAYNSLNVLHNSVDGLQTSLDSVNDSLSSVASQIGAGSGSTQSGSGSGSSQSGSAITLPISISDPQEGQFLIYNAATGTFRNQEFSNQQAVTSAQDVSHLMRLVENIYLALDVAGLNPGGYDNLSGDTFYGNASDINPTRSYGTLEAGKFYGDGAVLVTYPIELTHVMSKAHLVVKHQNVADAQIKAEISLQSATFVKGEVIAIGNGSSQTVTLAHTSNLSSSKFALYFDGVAQEDFSFNATAGTVTFNAANGVIVSADYIYNLGAENFVEMTNAGTYPDRRNFKRASTQFTFSGTAGNVATLRLTLSQGSGTSQISSTGTGKAQGIKLAHQAVESSIQVTPTTAAWNYNSDLNTVVITAPSGSGITISYQWRGKSFSVDSFACMFDE